MCTHKRKSTNRKSNKVFLYFLQTSGKWGKSRKQTKKNTFKGERCVLRFERFIPWESVHGDGKIAEDSSFGWHIYSIFPRFSSRLWNFATVFFPPWLSVIYPLNPFILVPFSSICCSLKLFIFIQFVLPFCLFRFLIEFEMLFFFFVRVAQKLFNYRSFFFQSLLCALSVS